MQKKTKLGVSNTPYDGGWWVTGGGWWVTDGGWCVTDGGWWVATKHQRVDAIVKKKKGVSVLMAPPDTWTALIFIPSQNGPSGEQTLAQKLSKHPSFPEPQQNQQHNTIGTHFIILLKWPLAHCGPL